MMSRKTDWNKSRAEMKESLTGNPFSCLTFLKVYPCFLYCFLLLFTFFFVKYLKTKKGRGYTYKEVTNCNLQFITESARRVRLSEQQSESMMNSFSKEMI